jgi:hypothetical protein
MIGNFARARSLYSRVNKTPEGIASIEARSQTIAGKLKSKELIIEGVTCYSS